MTGQKGATTPQLDPDSLELAPGTEHQNLEGWAPVLGSDAEVLDALEKAFDYRGDVTITCKDGSVVEGYIFDRRTGATLGAVLGPAFSQGFAGEAFDRLQRDRRPDLYRQRSRSRRKLGSLGEEVEREEGGRRKGLWSAS